ncbi:MAG: response regulator [Ignavibacteriae bacterium]|nr:response regulator [Ignavibacteria bacterium]MBI3365614.1 response regulator [Ignavibacteriota bacterium]
MDPSRLNILIVEDNLAHQRITEYVLKRNNVKANLIVVRDGQEVLDYLYRKNAYSDSAASPRPHLILLDLNLPKRDGREVLKVIMEDASLKQIPVVIVSTSDREEDIAYAFQTGAVAYISKSSGFDKFNEQLGTVWKYARAD